MFVVKLVSNIDCAHTEISTHEKTRLVGRSILAQKLALKQIAPLARRDENNTGFCANPCLLHGHVNVERDRDLVLGAINQLAVIRCRSAAWNDAIIALVAGRRDT